MICHKILKFYVIKLWYTIKFFKLVIVVSYISSSLKVFFLLYVTILFSCVVNAQTLISTQGHFIDNGNGSISYSIGEPVISTLSNTNGDVTQGFQQITITICNTNLQAIDDLHDFPFVSSVQLYEYKYTNQTTNIIYSNTGPNKSNRMTKASDANGNYIALSNSATHVLRAEYRVQYQNGNWSDWEYFCDITAPSIPTCNTSLNQIDDLINYPAKKPIPTDYEFKYTNQTSNIVYTNLRIQILIISFIKIFFIRFIYSVN